MPKALSCVGCLKQLPDGEESFFQVTLRQCVVAPGGKVRKLGQLPRMAVCHGCMSADSDVMKALQGAKVRNP